MNGPALKRFRNTPWAMPLALFALAFALRTCGLSHDLHEGHIYHPDTPKQIRAAERFIDGEYYTIIGGRDYEGYPYFNSHLVARIYRAYATVRPVARTHLGLPDISAEPDFFALFWVTRLLNAFLSSALVLLVYSMGVRFFDRPTGVIAALLLAISPVDITTAHFATGDSTTSFFATAAVLFALRIAHSTSYANYVAAALMTGAAFSTKYHGGMAALSVCVAHLVAQRNARQLFSVHSLRRLLTFGLSLVAAILVTSPALLIYPESAFKDILQFVEYTSSFGMTAEMRALSPVARFGLGMQVNLPDIAWALGWAQIVGLLPLAYVLIGLAAKPLTHSVYHTLATPSLLLLAAAGFTRLWRTPRFTQAARVATCALLLAAVSMSAAHTHRELFFFMRNDTRFMAETWARDNIPPSFFLRTGSYTFTPQHWHPTPATADAIAYAYSDRDRVLRAPAGSFPAYRFSLEDEKLTVFRNWNVQFYMPDDPAWITPHARRPGFQPLPSSRPNDIVFADAPWWVATPKVREWGMGDRDRLTIVSSDPLPKLLVALQAGPEPVSLRLNVAGTKEAIRLMPAERRVIWIHAPSAQRVASNDRYFYDVRTIVDYGSCHAFLATQSDEMAWLALYAQQLETAHQLFDRETEPLGYWISGLLSGAKQPDDPDLRNFVTTWQARTESDPLIDSYGVSARYLHALPGLSRDQIELIRQQKTRSTDDAGPDKDLPKAHLSLEPGRYELELIFSGQPEALHVRIADPWGFEMLDITLTPLDMDQTARVVLPFDVPLQHPLVRILIQSSTKDLTLLQHMQLRPDPAHTVADRLQWLRRVLDGDPPEIALRSLLPAAQPIERHPVQVRLANGMRLAGYEIDETALRAGDTLRLNLYWETRSLSRALKRNAVWIHGIPVDSGSTPLFYGDRGLRTVLALPPAQNRLTPHFVEYPLPTDLPPGRYAIKTGIWLPGQRRNIRVRESDLPHDKRGVFLTHIDIVESNHGR